MVHLLKYINLAKKKPAVIPRGLRGLFLTNILGKKVFRGAELAVTYQCQARCGKCFCRSLIEESRAEMSLDEIVEISNQIAKAGGILIDLTGGDALLRSDIVDIVKRLSVLPIIVSLATNGQLLNDTLLERLKDAGLHVLQFGIGSSRYQEHDAETGLEGSFYHSLSQIKKARQLGIEVLINTVITRQILHSERIEELVAIAQEYDSLLSFVLPAEVGGWAQQDVRLDQNDFAVIKKWLKKKNITMDTESSYRKGRCPAGTEKVYVSAYGDLYPCPFIHKKCGNLLKDPFDVLWQRMQKDVCHKCANIYSPIGDIDKTS